LTANAPVIELAAYVKAQRARDALVRHLGSWDWFLGSEVEVKHSGAVVILALTTVACSSTVRRDMFVCIPSVMNGVPVEKRPRNAATVNWEGK